MKDKSVATSAKLHAKLSAHDKHILHVHTCVHVCAATLKPTRIVTDHFLSSLALHPDKALVATAQIGKAPFICIWDCVTMETVSILQGGHERGIAALGFSGNGHVSRHACIHACM